MKEIRSLPSFEGSTDKGHIINQSEDQKSQFRSKKSYIYIKRSLPAKMASFFHVITFEVWVKIRESHINSENPTLFKIIPH